MPDDPKPPKKMKARCPCGHVIEYSEDDVEMTFQKSALGKSKAFVTCPKCKATVVVPFPGSKS